MKLKLLFDALALDSRFSGTRTRALGLLPELVRDVRLDVGLVHGPDLDDDERRGLEGVHLFEVSRPPRGPVARLRRLGAVYRPILEAFRPDRVVAECVPFPPAPALVPVVHDLRHLSAGGLGARAWRFLMERGLARATLVFTASETVARELGAALPAVAGRIRVVPNGVDTERFGPDPGAGDEEVRRRHGLPDSYMLFVGHLEPRKDPHLAVEVRAHLADLGINLPLVMVGRGELMPEEGLYGLKGAHPDQSPGGVLRDVPAWELPALYRGARLVLVPSRLEGFGLVPLEAAACGAPVIASDIPAHREVMGEGAFYAPPGSVEAFARRVLDLFYGELDVARAAECARERVALYSWSRAAEAFRSALGLPEAGTSRSREALGRSR